MKSVSIGYFTICRRKFCFDKTYSAEKSDEIHKIRKNEESVELIITNRILKIDFYSII